MMTSVFPLKETRGRKTLGLEKDLLETQLKLWGQRGVGSTALMGYWLPSLWWPGCQRLASRVAIARGRDHLLCCVYAALAQRSWLL